MRRRTAAALLRWIVLLALLAGGGALAAWWAIDWLLPAVTVTHAVEAPVVQAFYATGTLLPEREYPIKANNAGVVTSVMVDKGDGVKRDQPLAVVNEDSVQFRYDQAKAEREQKVKLADEKTSPALAELDARLAVNAQLIEIAQREQNRVTQMLERDAAAQSDLDRAMDRVKTLYGEIERIKAQRAERKLELAKDLEVAEAALRIAQWNLDRQTVRSPIDHGVVLDRPISVGTRVAANDHLMQVADVRPENLVMRAAVDEEDKTLLKPGQTVRMTLYAFADQVFEGKVSKIYDKADPERRTFEVEVQMAQKNPGFSAGMTGELAFVIDQKDRATVIPSQAVQQNAVWVVRDGRIEKADVKIGLRSVERTEILSGLRHGEQVIISPIGGLRGQRVRSQFVDPVAAAALNKPKTSEGSFRGFN